MSSWFDINVTLFFEEENKLKQKAFDIMQAETLADIFTAKDTWFLELLG